MSVYEQLVNRGGFSPAQKIILNLVTQHVSIANLTILEVGSSSGYLTRQLTQAGHLVDIVEVDRPSVRQARKYAQMALSGSIEDSQIRKKISRDYDLIILADVLEHLVDPEDTLEFLKRHLKNDGLMLISIPNVAFWDMRKKLFFKGDFEYQESGLLDKTHLHFYSLNNFLKLLNQHRLKILELIPAEARFPFEHSLSKIPLFGWLLIRLFKGKLIWFRPNLTFYHYVVKVTPQPPSISSHS